MNHRLSFKELGRSRYTIAAADGKVSAFEVRRRREVVREVLVPVEPATDTYGTDRDLITRFAFHVLADQGADPRGEYEWFIAYIGQHRKELSLELMATMLHTGEAVAKALHGV